MLYEVGSAAWWMTATTPLGAVARSSITPAALIAAAGTTTDATSFTTASITPTANRLVLAFVASRRASVAAPASLTGNGLTWVQVATISDAAVGVRLTAFRAMGSSPSAGTVVIDFAGVTQTCCAWSIVEFGGVNTSDTNGAGAVVQAVTSTVASGTSATNTLAALENANNIHVCGTAIMANEAIANDADFTEIGEQALASNAMGLETQRAVNQTACTPTWTTSTGAVFLSIEVKAG